MYRREVQHAADSAARAKAALIQLTAAQASVQILVGERDFALHKADSLDRLRVEQAKKARNLLAALGPEPTIVPDTCLRWVGRARDAEKAALDAVSSLDLAEKEVSELRTALQNDSLALRTLRTATNAVTPVLVEHSTVKMPQNGGRRLFGVPLPVLTVGYSAVLSCIHGCEFAHGPGATLGWQIHF